MARKSTGSGAVDINMTPIIDCTFLLIIFFILTARMAGENRARIAVPHPHRSTALGDHQGSAQPNRIIVNIPNRYGDRNKDRDPALSGRATGYQIGMTHVDLDDVAALTNLLKERKARAQQQGYTDVFVEVRGDRDVSYGHIEPVIQAVARAGIEKMSLTALVDTDVTQPQP